MCICKTHFDTMATRGPLLCDESDYLGLLPNEIIVFTLKCLVESVTCRPSQNVDVIWCGLPAPITKTGFIKSFFSSHAMELVQLERYKPEVCTCPACKESLTYFCTRCLYTMFIFEPCRCAGRRWFCNNEDTPTGAYVRYDSNKGLLY
jgi:hypothetical protein